MKAFAEVGEVAELLGLTTRAVERAIRRSLDGGQSWHGADLIIRQVPGRGGRSGLRYEVLVESLPSAAKARWKELQRPVEGRLSTGSKAASDRAWWYGLLIPTES